mgnify:FL=1
MHICAGCNLAREYMLASIVGLIGELGLSYLWVTEIFKMKKGRTGF